VLSVLAALAIALLVSPTNTIGIAGPASPTSGAPADSLDVTLEDAGPQTYFASEVLVVADRPDRLDAFAAEAVSTVDASPRAALTAPHASGGDYGTSAFPSIRGLPAEHVAVELDGVPLNSMQNGTFDLALLDLLGGAAAITRGPFAWLGATGASQAAVAVESPAVVGVSMAAAAGSTAGDLRIGVGGRGGSAALAVVGKDGPRENESLAGWSCRADASAGPLEIGASFLSAQRGLPGAADAPWSAGTLEDELVVARVRFQEVGRARPTLYATRHEQHYEDAISSPTHVVSSLGAVVAYDADREGAFRSLAAASGDLSVLDSWDPLNPDVGRHTRGSGSVVARATVGRGVLRSAAQCVLVATTDFGAAASGAVGFAAVGPGGRAWVSAGTTYRAPTMNELYWPADAWSEGNEDLEPERVLTGEGGVSLPLGRLTLGAAAYRSRASDLVLWTESNGIWSPRNVGTADLQGVELDAELRVAGLTLSYAGDFASAVDGTSALKLPYRPEVQHSFALSAVLGAAGLKLAVRSAGESYVDSANTETLPGYTVADASLALALPLEGMSLVLEGTNLTDESYATRKGYELEGRAWLAGLRITQLQNPW